MLETNEFMINAFTLRLSQMIKHLWSYISLTLSHHISKYYYSHGNWQLNCKIASGQGS